MEDAKAEKKAVTGPVVGMGGNPAAGQGTLDGAGTGFECEWRAGVMMGKVEKVWYRQYENGKVLVGEDASTTAGLLSVFTCTKCACEPNSALKLAASSATSLAPSVCWIAAASKPLVAVT